MKRIFALIFISLMVLSCSDEIELNTPSFQGTKNYTFWRTDNFQAITSSGDGIKIIGTSKDETLSISIENSNEGIYSFENSLVNTAGFEDENSISYSTLNNGDGEVVIENFDTENLTITGTFKLNAYSASGELVNFINGIFYNIPIVSSVSELDGSNSFQATVNEENIDVESVETEISDGQLYIKASNTDESQIEIIIPENIPLGGHTLNSSTQTYANYVYSDGAISSSQYGTLTILEHDIQFKKIKASFIFNTAFPDNIAVTNGNFVVYY